MGNGLLGTLLPVRAQLEDFSTLDIGVMGSCYFFGFAAGCYWGPHVVRRVGHIRAFTAMVSAVSTFALLYALLVHPFVWWPVRLLTGFCFAVLYMVIESWLNEKSTNANRGFIFSIYTIINLTVITIGQMLLTLGSPIDFPLFAVAAILISLAALPVSLTTSHAPQPIVAVKIRLGHLYRSSPVGTVGCLAVGLANGPFWALGPVFAQSNVFVVGTTGIALFMSAAVIAGAAGQWPLGLLSDKIDRRTVITISCVGGTLSGMGMAMFANQWESAVFGFALLFGMFAFPLYALCAAHMNDSVEEGGFVEASSGLLMLYAAGAVVGPLLASATMGLVGPNGLFLFTSFVHAATGLFVVHRMRQHARPDADVREPFAESARIAQTVAALDELDVPAEEQDSAA